ncbi:MAG: cell division protein FtsZ [Bacilli bacterium]
MEHKWGDWGFNFEPQNEQTNEENQEEQNVEKEEEVVQQSIFEENFQQEENFVSNEHEQCSQQEENTFVPEYHQEQVDELVHEEPREETHEVPHSGPVESYNEPDEESSSNYDDFDDFNDFDGFDPVANIKVIGVGGAGNNAVNRMIDEQISNVEFYVMNTDKQALSTSKARNRIVLGKNKYRGLGAGGDPRIGAEAAEISASEIRAAVKGADMVFIAAGEGGGTGTGAAPVVARIAKEEGALTVAIVTRPFNFEGKRRIAQAVDGLNKLKEHVDSIIVVSNDKLLMMNGGCAIMDAFAASDKVLAQSVKTVSDLITLPGIINLDFADIRTTLKDSGVALIGFGSGKGQNKVRDAAASAIASPLLEASIRGANSAIISVTCGSNVTLYEAQDAANEICAAAGNNLDMKYGVNFNTQLGDEIIISVIATDFSEEYDFSAVPNLSTLRPRPVAEKEEEHEEKEENNVIPSYLQNQK